MAKKEAKQLYFDFDQYIRQGEPDASISAKHWKTAIGLQAVDGLKPSQYLIETARRNIEGEISMDEVQDLLRSYYANEATRSEIEDNDEEADKAAANIKKILSAQTLAFNTNGYIATHRRIFEGVFKHAGILRKYDITKKEWVLKGDTVHYLNWEDLQRAIDYELQQEKDFSYKGLTPEQKVQHICRFTAGLWQIHAFAEGNTRTTAVFLIQYLRSIGFKVDNGLFADHSWYFRNALVRANYKNSALGIDYDFQYLERFFRNLLLGEQNELKNRYLIINAPDNWNSTQETGKSTQEKGDSTQETEKSTQEIILDTIKNNPATTRNQLSAVIGISPDGIKKQLEKLKKSGIIKHVGPTKGGHWEITSASR